MKRKSNSVDPVKVAMLVNKAKNGFRKHKAFHTAKESLVHVGLDTKSPQTESPAYQLAFSGNQFLLRDDMRHARLQLEYQKCDLVLTENNIDSTLVVFGGARIKDPKTAKEAYDSAQKKFDEGLISERELNIKKRMLDKSKYYEEARKFGYIAGSHKEFGVITTGGGPGIMQSAPLGAQEAGQKTIGLNIVLPFEQHPNPYISPEFCFNFHYFSVRKMHFLMRAKALLAFPGGFGTLDELFEALTLIQTKKMKRIPVILFGIDFWKSLINFEQLVDDGLISPEDLNLFQIVETAEEAWTILIDFYNKLE